jgi:AcrR family transcriptional regulator
VSERKAGDVATKTDTAAPERPAGTREAILDAAEKLFAERGFAGTSVRDIVRASESSPPSLYHFFGSKENLLVELVADRYASYCDALEAHLATATSAFEVCKQLIDFVLTNMNQQPNTAKFLFSIMFGPQQDIPKEPLKELLVRWELIVHQRLNDLAPGVPEERIIFARTMLNGLITPPVLLFLTSGTTTFPPDLSACLALRVADVLTDRHPVCAWPSFAVDEKRAD